MAEPVDVDFPDELNDKLSSLDEALTNVEDILKPLHNVPINQIHGKLNSLDKAKLDLLGAYAMNSLFWVYLSTKGETPKEHGIKQELDRIRSYMGRLKEIEEKEKAPKLNKGASKRFIRNALWTQAQSSDQSTNNVETDHQQNIEDKPPEMDKTKGKKRNALWTQAQSSEQNPSNTLQNDCTEGETEIIAKKKKKKKGKKNKD